MTMHSKADLQKHHSSYQLNRFGIDWLSARGQNICEWGILVTLGLSIALVKNKDDIAVSVKPPTQQTTIVQDTSHKLSDSIPYYGPILR